MLGVVLGIVTVASAEEAGPSSVVARRSATARVPVYGDMIRRWHIPNSEDPGLTPEGRQLLVLEILNTEERIELAPVRDDGGWSEQDLSRAAHALRDPRNGTEKTIDPRVLDLAYRVQVHFQAKALRVISCYRRGRSKHGKGRAIDIVVPGARDDEVARFARTFGFVGVGLYPRSGFVHIDTRPRSYFWVDSSGPGQKSRAQQVYGKVSEESDAKALERGESPPTFNLNGESSTTAGDDESEAASAKGSDDAAKAKPSTKGSDDAAKAKPSAKGFDDAAKAESAGSEEATAKARARRARSSPSDEGE
jgi:uncharacterized protein YcbK (DUF882 family)